MKRNFTSSTRRATWLLSALLLAGVVTLRATAQDAANHDADSTAQQAPAKKQQPSANDSQEVPVAYHLVYTLTQSDGGKQTGVQTFVMTISSDRNANVSKINVGSKVPVSANKMVTYIDVGLTITTMTKKALAGGLEVFSEVEQSSFSASSDAGIAQPVIRQSQLSVTAVLYLNKTVSLGSFDVPGSTQHYEVQVMLRPVR